MFAEGSQACSAHVVPAGKLDGSNELFETKRAVFAHEDCRLHMRSLGQLIAAPQRLANLFMALPPRPLLARFAAVFG